jgi:molybdenum-dependent DNA-binding transcriptional regulator ModE
VRHLNLDQLDTLLTVIDLGSFSAAARKLNLSQPAVSQQVKELEGRLGVPLIERSSPLPGGTTTPRSVAHGSARRRPCVSTYCRRCWVRCTPPIRASTSR